MRGAVGLLAVAGVALVIAGCTTTRSGSATAAGSVAERSAPSRAQLAWADQVCTGGTSLLAAQAAFEESQIGAVPGDARTNRRLKDLQVSAYLSTLPSDVSEVVATFDALRPIGDAAADGAVRSLREQLRNVQSQVGQGGGPPSFDPAGGARQNGTAKRMDTLLDAVPSPENTVLAKARQDPVLARAIKATRSCTPEQAKSAALPPAADGTDGSACRDGACEIEVSGRTEVRVADTTLLVTVRGTAVNVGVNYGSGGAGSSSVGTGGSASFGDSGQTIKVTVPGIRGDTAVVRFATSGS